MAAFSTLRTLAFGDCDPSGIAYFPAYLDLMVGATEEFFAHIGHSWPDLMRDRRIGTPTVTLNLDFERPGFHGDALRFEIAVVRVGRTSLDLNYRVSRGAEMLWRAEQRLVATSLEDHRPTPWPAALRAALEAAARPDDG